MSSILDIPTPWAVLALLNQRRRPTLAGHCARPRCEHPASRHVVIGGCNIDTERGLCPCPGYRTPEQQEAREGLDGVMQGDPELWPELVLDAAEKVWRAYP